MQPNYLKKTFSLLDNYLLARWQNRPSTALFWYLKEPANINSLDDLEHYQNNQSVPFYLLDYKEKLKYSLKNNEDIIVLPYGGTIGDEVNPEAAFQYALGAHDQYQFSKNEIYLKIFWHYVNYFIKNQTSDGLWSYNFDWFGSKAPWYSALAQSRGSSLMLRAWMHSKELKYLDSAKHALSKFTISTEVGGFLHVFTQENCMYFEEYPKTPTGVLNGFMAALLGVWEMQFWTQEKWIKDLWTLGINSLEKMLPSYSINWWSLYDLDNSSPILNVNSPRYHLLELNYLKILSLLSKSAIITKEYENRLQQYNNFLYRYKALGLKFFRKIVYR